MERGLISVDRWSDGSQAYFLTHLHSDHTRSLTSSWSKGPLFCSRITAKLFPLRFPGFDLSLLRVIDVDSWHSFSLLSPSSGSNTVLQVIAIDAHHCPGSVMFLFRGDFGCLLYTGDFRWEGTTERAERARATLLNALQDNAVDVLYLDNTYCNPSYEFPSREVAAQLIADIITAHPKHDIIIGIHDLGKEELLVHISRVLNIKIWVWPERLQTMHLLGFHDIFTTKTYLTRVRAVPRYSFSINTLEGLNSICPTIGIMPSGLPWMVKPIECDGQHFGSPLTYRNKRTKNSESGEMQMENLNGNLELVKKFHKYIYSVPYSDHSCFAEIQSFIELVQPHNMKGIVSSSSCYVDPIYYFGCLCGASRPAKRLHCKHENKKGGNQSLAVQGKLYIGSGKLTEIERQRRKDRKAAYLGVRLKRLRSLRWVQRGAKLADIDFSD